MRRNPGIEMLLAGAFLFVAGAAHADPKPQTTCPITGHAIDRSVYADHDGHRIYFCCEGCIEKFKADPAGAIERLTASGVQLAEAGRSQTHCPIMGGDIDLEVFADHEGKRVYFCCPGCIGKFEENASLHIERMEKAGIELAKTPNPQTMCPVMDMAIDRQFFVDHDGERIYFCCAPCIEKFNQDPSVYLEKMRDAGAKLEEAPAGR